MKIQDFGDFKTGYTLIDDMILADEQYKVLYFSNAKNDVVKAVNKWPSSTIPYLLDTHFSIILS